MHAWCGGLNSLGVSMALLNLAHDGINPTHTHPHIAEVLTAVKGEMLADFLAADGRSSPGCCPRATRSSSPTQV
jgi:hypothetical protein